MNILKIIFAVMVVFDVGYLFFYFGYDLITTVIAKIRKKKKPDPVVDEYDIEEDAEDFSYAPPLCIDSIRLVYGNRSRDLVTDRIFSLSKEITDQLSDEDKEQVVLLLSSFIKYLHDEAPNYEQNFTVVMELLNASTATYDPERRDPVDKLLDDSVSRNRDLPDYYLDYQKYRITCKNKAHILLVCKVLILTVLKKLYGEWYSPTHELYNPKSVEELLRDAKWKVFDIETEDV